MPLYLYTLFNPEDGKYFVGSSTRILADPLVHFKTENADVSFLEDHPMREVVSREKVQSLDALDSKVLDLMTQYGALNVRGGSYMILNKEIIADLIGKKLNVSRRTCILCQSKRHSSAKCTEYNSDDDSDYIPSEHSESDDNSDLSDIIADEEEDDDEEDMVV